MFGNLGPGLPDFSPSSSLPASTTMADSNHPLTVADKDETRFQELFNSFVHFYTDTNAAPPPATVTIPSGMLPPLSDASTLLNIH